jgi:hypothetical protein
LYPFDARFFSLWFVYKDLHRKPISFPIQDLDGPDFGKFVVHGFTSVLDCGCLSITIARIVALAIFAVSSSTNRE